MPKSPASFLVIWIDTKGLPVLDYVAVADQASLEARVLSLTSQSTQYTVVDQHGKIVEISIDTSPRITFGAKPAAKPRAKRRTKAEMAAASKAKANGAGGEGKGAAQ